MRREGVGGGYCVFERSVRRGHSSPCLQHRTAVGPKGCMDQSIAENETPNAGPARQALVCGTCNFPLALKEDLHREPVEPWRPAVFSYQFDIFNGGHIVEEGEESEHPDAVLAYSATNPGQHRFDVVLVKPCPGVRIEPARGPKGHWTRPTIEHTWFRGYGWRQAYCAVCQNHVGWGYSPWVADEGPSSTAVNDSDEDSDGEDLGALSEPAEPSNQAAESAATTSQSPPETESQPTEPYLVNSSQSIKFVGLIVTRTTVSELDPARLTELEQARAQILDPLFSLRYERTIRSIISMLNNLPVAIAGSFYGTLSAMRVQPALRTGIFALENMIRGVAESVRNGTVNVVNREPEEEHDSEQGSDRGRSVPAEAAEGGQAAENDDQDADWTDDDDVEE